jgi:hypothetical protein
VDPRDLRHAYGLARDAMRSFPDSLAGRAGHRLFWVRAGSSKIAGGTALPAHPAWDAATIVGRHPQCGIVLAEDNGVALRHVLLRSISSNAAVGLRALDLQTDVGFMLSDGSSQTSVFAEGPAAFGLGSYALVALPMRASTEGTNERFPTDFPPPSVESSREVRDQLAAMEQAMSPYRMNARPPSGSSRITLMPRLVMMGERPFGGEVQFPGRYWKITLERDGRSAMETVGEEEVAGGLLIGRSEKCHSEVLRRITDYNTSRAHVLIIREGEQICAYDLASTHGLYQGGAPVRRVVLGPTATLTLGRSALAVRVTWRQIV